MQQALAIVEIKTAKAFLSVAQGVNALVIETEIDLRFVGAEPWGEADEGGSEKSAEHKREEQFADVFGYVMHGDFLKLCIDA
ncbi:MAG TPA: hypothetical protein VFA90_10345 [Terriglobales bacterium]|nr:hypothetical protein [Terriglobales bacterium]